MKSLNSTRQSKASTLASIMVQSQGKLFTTAISRSGVRTFHNPRCGLLLQECAAVRTYKRQKLFGDLASLTDVLTSQSIKSEIGRACRALTVHFSGALSASSRVSVHGLGTLPVRSTVLDERDSWIALLMCTPKISSLSHSKELAMASSSSAPVAMFL